MRSTLLVLTAAAGVVVGAAVTHSLNRVEPRVPTLAAEPSSALTSSDTALAPERQAANAVGSSTTAARAELYRVAAAADARELSALIRSASEQEPSAARTFALEVLLARYAEIDPEAAIAAAANLDASLRAPLYAAWAVTDPADALAALAEIDDAATARTIAAALVPALGGDERALRQVAAAVPFGVESAVYVAAITARAASDPTAAFEQALALTDPATRTQALEGVAQSWVRIDPRAALTAADSITDPFIEQPFLFSIARAWVRLDPDASLAYLASLDPSVRPDLFNVLGGPLSQVRPREILALDTSPLTPAGMQMRMLAVQALANQDPELALREAEALPLGGQRENAIMSVARGYGTRDAEAALAWARASGDANRMLGVLQGIAQRDPGRALDLAIALESPQQRMQAVQYIAMSGAAGPTNNTAVLADRVLALGDQDLRDGTLRQLLGMWSSRAPDAAVDWLITHQVSSVQGSYAQAAQQLARNSPARAIEQTARVPAAARTEWIQGVAEGYAQTDPRGAAEWLAQYRGDPAYDAAVGPVATNLAAADPPAAARLLSTSGNREAARQAAYAVAAQWAQRDPLAAAAWAADYDADLNQPLAVPSVAAAWTQTDAPAARAWTLRLPSGQARDAALTALLSARVTETVDTSLLDAFSNPSMRDQTVMNMGMQLGSRDRAAAERFLDTYLTNEAMRENAKRNLERIPSGAMNQRGFGFGVAQDIASGMRIR